MLTAAFVLSGRMGMTLFERIESDFAQATAVLPYGSAVEKTEGVQEKLVKAAQEIVQENGGETWQRESTLRLVPLQTVLQEGMSPWCGYF